MKVINVFTLVASILTVLGSSQAFCETTASEFNLLEASAAKKWHLECDGISDRGISNLQFSSLAACQRAAHRACVTRDGRLYMDADCAETTD